MPTIPKFNPIEYLVSRRYGVDRYGNGGRGPAPSESEEAAVAYRCELEALSPGEVDQLAADAIALDAEERERNRPFNSTSAAPDYQHWARLAFWSADEAVALALDRDPQVARPKVLEPLAFQSALARRFVDLREVVRRAVVAGELRPSVAPAEFLRWTMSRQIDFPAMLATLVVALQPPRPSAAGALEEARASFAALSARDDEPTKERGDVAALQGADGKALSAKERVSCLKLIVGMAATKYHFKPGAIRQPAAGNIARDLHSLGLDLDEDTVRKWLSEAAPLLATNQSRNRSN